MSIQPIRSLQAIPLACLASLALLGGCGESGPQLAPVSGTVTLDGQPLATADVLFQPEEAMKSPSVGQTDAAGHFVLAYKRGVLGAVVGPHTVRISVSRELVRNPPNIPARYDAQSELRSDVKRGDNTFEFNLTSGGSP